MASDEKLRKQVAVAIGLTIYARLTGLAMSRMQVVGEDQKYYVTLEQLENAFVSLREEIEGE